MTSYAVVDQRLDRSVTIMLDREVYQRLVAAANGRPLSTYVREMLKRNLEGE